MGQSATPTFAALMGAQIKLAKEECVSDMGQRSNDAAVKDAQINAQKGGVCIRHGAKRK